MWMVTLKIYQKIRDKIGISHALFFSSVHISSLYVNSFSPSPPPPLFLHDLATAAVVLSLLYSFTLFSLLCLNTDCAPVSLSPHHHHRCRSSTTTIRFGLFFCRCAFFFPDLLCFCFFSSLRFCFSAKQIWENLI